MLSVAPTIRPDDFAAQIGAIALHLFGPPNRALSKPGREIRFGRHGSLAVDLVKNVWHDHERGQGGGVLDLVIHAGAARDRPAAATWLRDRRFLDDRPPLRPSRPGGDPRSTPVRLASDDVAGRIARAQAIWREGRDPRGTAAEHYLVTTRGLALTEELCGRVIKFHRKLWCTERGLFTVGMVAAFRPLHNDDPDAPPVAIQRWFLEPDGTPLRNADGTKLKRMLGPTRGCAIKLSDDTEVEQGLAIAEGFETALAVYLNGWRPTWAMGSSSTIQTLPVLNGIEELRIFADADPAGLEAARVCRDRWRAARRQALVIRRKAAGLDWADPCDGSVPFEGAAP